MSLLAKKVGILTTIQDLGRRGYRRFGVNPNGAMDPAATRILNTLLGNDSNAAVLEFHFPAGEFEFEMPVCFALGGGDFAPELDSTTILNWRVYEAGKGAMLKFPKKVAGNRVYLAVAGGFAVDQWLGSSSTSLVASMGGFEGRRVRSGDRIKFSGGDRLNSSSAGLRLGESFLPQYSGTPKVRITAGPEFDLLTGNSQQSFQTDVFRISPDSNRMGFRLTGPPLRTLSTNEILSSGTTFGTIQLLSDGQLIVLMADHQTTGGYPRIGTVAAVDLSLIAQLGPGNGVSFELIEIEKAENLMLEFEKSLAFLRTGFRVRTGVL